ncbi:zinc-dependent peptidase [Piscinibacter sp.]|uniref:M90 family metallopeptidase n=1 Tax=Piscinibacter sp. TaxID=1903157 RepID=UPI002F425D18
MLSRWWRRWRKLRDERILRRRPIPDALWQLTLARYPFLARRGPADRAMLRELATLFLARKEFTGAQGFQLSDEIAVAVAAQACLPVLRLGLDCYDGFVGIVMHRDEVVARREVMDESGVVHHYDETLTGEAMEGGPVMLSWRDVESAGESAEWGYNVVIHEFAHVLDMRDGLADGMPPLPDRPAREQWMAVISDEYQRFCEDVDAGHDTLLDPYGAQSIDEFFAVATEVFFVAPADMAAEHPRLYRLLAGYYLQDPAAETRAP